MNWIRWVCVSLVVVGSGQSEPVFADEDVPTVDYSSEAASANYDREREEYLIRQGSTRSEKFSVHEGAKPKTQRSAIVDSDAASRKTYSTRSQNGSGSVTYGGSYRRSASSAGRGMTYAEREEAKTKAANRYNEAIRSGSIPPQEDLAGDDYKSELEALLNSMK